MHNGLGSQRLGACLIEEIAGHAGGAPPYYLDARFSGGRWRDRRARFGILVLGGAVLLAVAAPLVTNGPPAASTGRPLKSDLNQPLTARVLVSGARQPATLSHLARST